MKVAVKDANVLIDLVEGDLLGLWFRLGIETHVPDLVLEEIKNPEQRRIVMAMVEAGNLRVGRFEPTQVLRIDSYTSARRAIACHPAERRQARQERRAVPEPRREGIAVGVR